MSQRASKVAKDTTEKTEADPAKELDHGMALSLCLSVSLCLGVSVSRCLGVSVSLSPPIPLSPSPSPSLSLYHLRPILAARRAHAPAPTGSAWPVAMATHSLLKRMCVCLCVCLSVSLPLALICADAAYKKFAMKGNKEHPLVSILVFIIGTLVGVRTATLTTEACRKLYA